MGTVLNYPRQREIFPVGTRLSNSARAATDVDEGVNSNQARKKQ